MDWQRVLQLDGRWRHPNVAIPKKLTKGPGHTAQPIGMSSTYLLGNLNERPP